MHGPEPRAWDEANAAKLSVLSVTDEKAEVYADVTDRAVCQHKLCL